MPYGFAEYFAVLDISQGVLKGALHQATGASSRLNAPACKTAHGEIKAATEALTFADHMAVRHEVLIEKELVAVHAAVPDRADRGAA